MFQGLRARGGAAALVATLIAGFVWPFGTATVARAEDVGGFHVTLSPYAGMASWWREVDLKNRPFGGARGGILLGRHLGIEGFYDASRTEKRFGSSDVTAEHYGGNLLLKLGRRGAQPFLVGGWHQVSFDPDGLGEQTFNGWEAGGGLLVPLSRRWDLRAEGRDVMFEQDAPLPGAGKLRHNLLVSLGIQVALGGSVSDVDGDGVPDSRDLCPNTPAGAVVDADGCERDADGDGVPDGIDTCPRTPAGARVDATGCPSDGDGDGVFDGIDRCPETPAGALVDPNGCPSDSDGDGVLDGLDLCGQTPARARVDADGCPIDSDGDGVYDGIDACPDTPRGTRVDRNGCAIREQEAEFLDTGTLRLNNVTFRSGKWDLRPSSHAVLDEVGKILVKWPELRVEIAGHTDSQGAATFNLELSRKRAEAVLVYLLRRFPQLDRSRFTVRGYGEGQPLADNRTPQGRATNRRVEFKILNRGVIRH